MKNISAFSQSLAHLIQGVIECFSQPVMVRVEAGMRGSIGFRNSMAGDAIPMDVSQLTMCL